MLDSLERSRVFISERLGWLPENVLGAALLIAVVGSAIPALLIAKVRPAEVMRAE